MIRKVKKNMSIPEGLARQWESAAEEWSVSQNLLLERALESFLIQLESKREITIPKPTGKKTK